MSKQQQGFTLVELIVVIVILGILAATAIPRFVDVTGQARSASVQGFAGGLRSAVGTVQAGYYAAGSSGATSVTMADTTVVTVAAGTGIPTVAANGIGRAIAGTGGCLGAAAGDCQGFTFASATGTFQPTNGGGTNCQVTYTGAGLVTTDVSGC